MQKKACVHTIGCRLNQSETAVIAKKLEESDYKIVTADSKTDLVVINTCTVTSMADAKSRNAVRSLIRKNPNAFVAVIGCYSQVGYDALSKIKGIDLILGTQEKQNVLQYITKEKNDTPLIVCSNIKKDDFKLETIGQSELSTRANLKIQDGCDFMCSFCIIPFARGRSRSRDFDDIIKEAKILVRKGFREIVITGVNVGTYTNKKKNIADVIDQINKIKNIKRIRISSIEPTTIPCELFDMMNDPKHALVPYLHIPMQSGSDRILKAMNRKYTAKEYKNFIDLCFDSVKDICIGSDILTGFPGETDKDFKATYKLLKDSPLNYAHIFTFSERSGTKAAHMSDKVSSQIIKSRSLLLRQLSEAKRKNFSKRFIGRQMGVLFEEKKDGFWQGYTCNFIRVAVQSRNNLENKIHNVKLETLKGKLIFGRLEKSNN